MDWERVEKAEYVLQSLETFIGRNKIKSDKDLKKISQEKLLKIITQLCNDANYGVYEDG